MSDGLYKKINKLSSETDELSQEVKELADDIRYDLKVINVLFFAIFLQQLLFWLIR